VKAVVIAAGSAEASIAASATPSPAPNESLVRVRRVLLAAEDHLDFARRRGFAGVPGSLFGGVVEQSGARGPAVGARVVAEAAVPCGTCAACRSGLSPACPDRTIAGLLGRDGALAELVAMPSAQLVELPEAVDDDRAVFAPLLGTGLLLDRRLGLGEAAFITVIGRGVAPIAATLALRARHPRARLLSDDPQTAAAAERLSLAHRPIGDAGRRRDQDAVVDFDVAGNGWESIDASMLRSLRHVEASLHGVGRGLAADGLPLLARRSIDPLPLLARRVGLEEAASWLGGGSPSDLDGTLATIGSEPRAGGNPS
jgi:threonine dehydrogenase-like Zn-dependent dehydrogenase